MALVVALRSGDTKLSTSSRHTTTSMQHRDPTEHGFEIIHKKSVRQT